MQIKVVTATTPAGLAPEVRACTDRGWEIRGGPAYGDGVWIVLLVKEEEKEELQYPYKPERTMAYQKVAQGELMPMAYQEVKTK